MKPTVLIVDDEVSICKLLEVFFEKRGYTPVSAQVLPAALRLLDGPEPMMAMVDLALGPDSGLTLLKTVVERYPGIPVMVMTAFGSVEKVVETMQLGAIDFISKPFDMLLLGQKVDKAMSKRALELENRELRDLVRRPVGDMVGLSPAILQLKDRINAIASSGSTVLITGGSGTGKELVAQLIHQKSLRALRPFVVVNCSALSESLLESELFGHVKGAFTSAYADKVGLFAVANGGTVFLDEIGEMPMRTQVKLLRVIQEREITEVGGTTSSRIDVRILAATNVNLEDAVGQGRFREDLYYRLNVLRIYTPTLAERGEDSILLANHFLKKKSRGSKSFTATALAQIRACSWPGNVRQLENAVERAIAYSSQDVIDSLEFDLPTLTATESVPAHGPTRSGSMEMPSLGLGGEVGTPAGSSPTLNEIEKAYIYWVLSQNQWHKPTAAKILGLDISTLYRKIERYGLKIQS